MPTLYRGDIAMIEIVQAALFFSIVGVEFVIHRRTKRPLGARGVRLGSWDAGPSFC